MFSVRMTQNDDMNSNVFYQSDANNHLNSQVFCQNDAETLYEFTDFCQNDANNDMNSPVVSQKNK